MVATRQIKIAAGAVIEVSGRRVGDPGRLGEIVEVLGGPERPHYLVRWEDGQEEHLVAASSLDRVVSVDATWEDEAVGGDAA